MNKFGMFLLFACVANSYANQHYASGQPKYPAYSESAPAYGAGEAYAQNPVAELTAYEGPQIFPALYSHAADAKYSGDNAHLPVNTYGNILGSKTIKAIWESVNPLAKSYAQVQNPKAPRGKYQQFAVPGFKIVEIVVEPNYNSDKHNPASTPPAAPAYPHETAPAAPTHAHKGETYVTGHSYKATAYAPVAPAHPHKTYAPTPSAYSLPGPTYAIVSSDYTPAADSYAPSGPAHNPFAEAYAPADAYVPSAPVYTPSAVAYAPSSPSYASKAAY